MDSPAKFIDHTLLKADATEGDVAVLCEEAVENGFASVCVPPAFAARASQLLYGSEVAVGSRVSVGSGVSVAVGSFAASEVS